MRSTPSLRSFPNVAFETGPMFVGLTMAFSRPFKDFSSTTELRPSRHPGGISLVGAESGQRGRRQSISISISQHIFIATCQVTYTCTWNEGWC